MHVDVEREKQAAAEAAAELVEDGMTVGLGTGSTVAFFLPALARRHLSLRCVPSSPRTEAAAQAVGLQLESFENLNHFDVAIDGADQVSPDGWLVKGGGGAHTREKLLAVSADRFVVIVDSTKPVPALHPPVPLELMAFGLASTLRRLGPVTCRDVPRSPDGGVIADYTGSFEDPGKLATFFESTPGVVGHGLFPPSLVSTVLVARGRLVESIQLGDHG
jgi:ribose 5-phosphate isomerase A